MKPFFDTIRRTLFDGDLSQSQVDGINGVLQAFDEVGDGDQDTLAYALATAYHETGAAMVPNRENMNYTSAQRIFDVFGRPPRRRIKSLAEAQQYVRKPRELANKVYNGMLGNRQGTDDGWVFRGAGHPHLTGRDNYRRSSADAGVDLVANPEAMLDPRISARVLIKGIMDGRWNARGHGLGYYEGADDFLSDAEAEEARRTVNVKDKAAQIARYHRRFYDALDLAGWQPQRPAQAQEPAPHPAPATGGLLAALLRALAALFGGKT